MGEMDATVRSDFIRDAIREDLALGRFSRVHTRFPPEPNGYLHIGHAKAICISFGIAEEFSGLYNLRFDDTNPAKEDVEYVEAIQEDIRWLGFDWQDRLFYASDYFEHLFKWAVQLIREGKAYVDSLSADEIREYRGTLTGPGTESPHRNRPVQENLDLFERMRAGEFADGTHVLRAKIDMSSGNMNLRDPVMYRILHATHHRTGDKWCIYPMYDWAHGQSDSIEGITHSLCSLEYEDHRPLYDWFLDQLGVYHPRQIEFAKYGLTYTVLGKRYLLRLVEEGYVSGWDDPRMPTLAGMRRRGYPSEAIRTFCDITGISKSNSVIDIALLEHCVREDLNRRAPRVMAVLRPLKVVIDNYPEGQVEEVEAINNPEDKGMGTRQVPFSRELYIEQEDYRQDAPTKWFRLAPGREVRLKHAYYITCQRAVKDKDGQVVALHCTYDPASRGGWTPDGRKVRGTLHWVSAAHALDAEIRLYDRLYTREDPSDVPEGADFTSNLNPNSLETLTGCKVEPSLAGAAPGSRFQFLRLGYFCVDPDSEHCHSKRSEEPHCHSERSEEPHCHSERSEESHGTLVFNRTVPLRDTWAKIEGAQAAVPAAEQED